MRLAEVWLWNRVVGAVALAEGADVAEFEFDPQFQRDGMELAPLTMPLSGLVYRFPALRRESFHGLPGLLADSLPDRFGNALPDPCPAGFHGRGYLHVLAGCAIQPRASMQGKSS